MKLAWMVLVDEAHGAHLHFTDKLPISAMDAGADLAAVSMHKSGGSLTQSSLLLIGEQMNPEYVRQIINLTQSTSASYLLMASLDISRRNLALVVKNPLRRLLNCLSMLVVKSMLSVATMPTQKS